MTPEHKVRRAMLNMKAHSHQPTSPNEAERLLLVALDLEAFAASLRRLAAAMGTPAEAVE